MATQSRGETKIGAGTRWRMASFEHVETLRQGKPLVVDDIRHRAFAPIVEALRAEGVRNSANVPLIAAGEFIGTINLASEKPGAFSNEEVEIVGEIVGAAAVIKKVFRRIEQVAATDSTVLLLGETGTGKELVARAIHKMSRRKDRALIKVNCAALPAGLIESELFGHEKGAFTGALARKIGRFELANGGTIFLDEIGDLPLDLQIKLLRILQEGEFERVGGTQTLKADVRVIAATNRDLEQAIVEAQFRSDLFYRLNVFPIHIPPLRERKEDNPVLVGHFARRYGSKLGKKIQTIPQKTMQSLQVYPWPGNVRELENVIERAVIISPGAQLALGDWIPRLHIASNGKQLLTIEELERNHILEMLELTGWRVSGETGAAKLLGLKPTTLEARMKKLGIKRKGLNSVATEGS